MKRISFIVVIAATLIFARSAYPHLLQWDLEKDDRLELVKTASVQFYVNRRINRTYMERNIIDLTCYGKDESGLHVKGVFSVFMRENGEQVFRLNRKEHADFTILRNGRYVVPKEFIMPNLRHIPVFPEKDIAVGETWNAPAELVLDHLSRPFTIDLRVSYKLREVKTVDGKDIAVIEYSFEKEMDLTGKRYPPDFPLKIGTVDKGILYWDIKGKRPVDGTDVYKIIFLQSDGKTVPQFTMNIRTAYKVYDAVKPEDKEKAKEELKKELEDHKGISVDTDERGIVLRLGEVLFDFDSARLRDDTQNSLNAVIDAVKKKYPDREIIVEGHTDSTGEKNYNQTLSEKRAEAVAAYLKNGVEHDKISYRGFGPDRPMMDNSSKEGRAKNRRVEIIIKLK
jgi:outer membrane protein OmpA-like peptidoglycan-associated protein